jgi:hypothetical protein
MRTWLVALVALAVTAGVAHAYPQYQLTKERTCASCHVSPVGGGLLAGMGEMTAQDESQWGGNPSFLHGKIELPEWLHLGGDLRGVPAGVTNNGNGALFVWFPMQAELYGEAHSDGFSAYVTVGATTKDAAFQPWFREHWLMWKPHEGGDGPYVRIGRLMPVFGLRQPEHIFVNRRYGGTPLYAEAYGINAGWLSGDLEAHFTAFVHDSLVDGVEKGDGGAIYVERRFGTVAALGVESRYAKSDLDTRVHGGLTGKLWLEGSKLLLQAEGQVIRESFETDGAAARTQLVGQVLATYLARPGMFVDLGVGHFDEDLAIAKLDRDNVDLNVHWMPTAHFELVLMTRYEMIGLGNGGDSSGYGMLQVHYRI